MMKRFLCLMICLTMVLTSVSALAAEDYSLMEKLQRQITFGNGVKGAVQLRISGESELAQTLSALNQVQIEIRSIVAQNGDQFQASLFALDGEEQVGTTQIYGVGDNLYLRSELLPDLVLTYPTGGNVIDSLLQRSEEQNPTWYSAAMNLFTVPESTWNESWAPLFESYYTDLELWLSDFAQEPKVIQGAVGETVMTILYTIPADALKDEMKVMLAKALNDQALMTLVRAQLDEEQAYTYLTPGLQYYYDAAIDALPLEGDVLLERELSTMGETVSTSVTLPLPGGLAWDTLTMEQVGEDSTLTLTGEEESIALEMKKTVSTATSDDYCGIVRVQPAEGKDMAVNFQLRRVFNHYEDDDTRAHDVTTWTLHLAADESVAGDEDYMTFEPIDASVRYHVHSKSAKRNATTLEFAASYDQGSESYALEGSIKTVSPWVLDALPTEGAEDVTAMTENYLGEILDSLWQNALAKLSSLNPEEIPAPEAAATATDLASSTDAAPTAVPALTTAP